MYNLKVFDKIRHENKNIYEDRETIFLLDNVKFEVVNKIGEYAKEKGYEFLDIDGVKVLFDDGWALVRASNTGPNITARFEAKTVERLEEIQKEFINLIEEFNK